MEFDQVLERPNGRKDRKLSYYCWRAQKDHHGKSHKYCKGRTCKCSCHIEA